MSPITKFVPELLRRCLISFGIHYPSHTLGRSQMILVVLHDRLHEIQIPQFLNQMIVRYPHIQNVNARMDHLLQLEQSRQV
jgi:predicted metal-dependent RNase